MEALNMPFSIIVFTDIPLINLNNIELNLSIRLLTIYLAAPYI